MIEIEITVRRDGKKFDYDSVTSGADTREIFYQLARGSVMVMRKIDPGPSPRRWADSLFDTPHIEAE